MKYKILKPIEARKWEVGDILQADERSAENLLEQGIVEPYDGEESHKHVAITVDPVKLGTIINI